MSSIYCNFLKATTQMKGKSCFVREGPNYTTRAIRRMRAYWAVCQLHKALLTSCKPWLLQPTSRTHTAYFTNMIFVNTDGLCVWKTVLLNRSRQKTFHLYRTFIWRLPCLLLNCMERNVRLASTRTFASSW